MKLNKFLNYKLALCMLDFSAFSLPVLADDTTDREAIRAQMIASNPLHNEQISMDALLLPRNLYILKGNTEALSRVTLYHRNVYLSPFSDAKLSNSSSYGTTLLGRWFYESNIHSLEVPKEAFKLNFSLSTPVSTTNTATNVEIVEQTNTNPVRLLAIGDSLTRMGGYLEQVESVLTNVETVGTVSYTNETIAREGRGGWTLNKYFSYIGTSEYLDSPFVFPTNVSGSQYKGNTVDWKKICTANSNDSAYGGFQKLARGWKDTGEYLYDANGYYKYPSIGDVMVNPTLPEDSKWIEWNGTAWVPMLVQPTTFEFNFSKYLERFAIAYEGGAPTHVSILLGANDFGTFDTLMDMPGYLNYMQQLIDSIHAYDPTIKIIICTPTLGPNQSIITEDTAMYYRYDRNIKLATYYILHKYDNDESLAQNIYLAPLTLTLDTANGYDYEKTTVDVNGELITKVKAKHSLHPNDYGHILMGDTLAAVIQKTRNQTTVTNK